MHIWKKRKMLNKLSRTISYISKIYDNDFDIDPRDMEIEFIDNRQKHKNEILSHFSKIVERILLEN